MLYNVHSIMLLSVLLIILICLSGNGCGDLSKISGQLKTLIEPFRHGYAEGLFGWEDA